MDKPINIVYFGFINVNRNWQVIIEGQLDDIMNCGILNKATLYIQMVCENESEKIELQNIIHKKLLEIDYYLDIKNENRYEYDGIKKIYDLAVLEPDKLYLYLHTKGMVYLHTAHDNVSIRTREESFLTKKTLEKWEYLLNMYESDEDGEIIKMALFPSKSKEPSEELIHIEPGGDSTGICWFNFFWARGSYIKTCEDPKIEKNRFYYENWIRTSNIIGVTFNIIEDDFKGYSQNEVCTLLLLYASSLL